MKRALTLLISLILCAPLGAQQQNNPVLVGNPSLRREVEAAMSRGTEWLIKNQEPGGYWSVEETPAVTGLALVALLSDPGTSARKQEAVKKGFDYLRGCVKPNGAIFKKEELLNYNTALALLAFSALNDPKDKTIIQNARAFLVGTQVDMGEKGKNDSVFDGGVGYGSKYEHSDMANTLTALEAIYHSRPLVTDTAQKQPELDFAAAIQFLQNCQHLTNYNKQAWVSEEPADKGGFVYHPAESKAGETNINGRVALRAYGSISYAGMMSYIYAGLSRDDARVSAVLDWLERNYTLEENPGMGAQGLYYYYHTMAKALNAAGVDKLESGSKKVNWREQLALKMFNLQKGDGSWQNDNGRWWEKDSSLVTAYGVLTLKHISEGL